MGQLLCLRSMDPEATTEKERQRAVKAWISSRLDEARRTGKAHELSQQKRTARAKVFASELETFFSASTSLPEATATKLRAIGEPIISAAHKIVRGQTEIGGWPAYRQLGKMIVTRHRSQPDHWRFRAIQWINSEMRAAGWFGPHLLTIGTKLARYRRDPTIDSERRAAVIALARVSLKAKAVSLPAGGSTWLQRLLRATGPIYREWTGRSPYPPRDLEEKDADTDAQRLRHSLYEILNEAAEELTGHWAEPFDWCEQVKVGSFRKAARVLPKNPAAM